MALFNEMLEQLRGLDIERRLGLRPAYPRIAVELDRSTMSIVRLKAARRGRPVVEAARVEDGAEPSVPATIFDQDVLAQDALVARLRGLFERSGSRPAKVSLLLPDNLAKLSLLTLPERPPSRRQLDELIRFKIRRGVPFRLSDAVLSYQVLPGDGKGVNVLVAIVRQSLVERYERALEAIGARPGLVDLCTPNLLNLCRRQIAADSAGADVALLNCAGNYFSLAIVRDSRLIFLRCKTYSMSGGGPAPVNGLLARELAYSLSYYEEKLDGRGIKKLLVRTVDPTLGAEDLPARLSALAAEQVELIDPVAGFDADNGAVTPQTAQRLAPALGAVMGRS